MKKILHIPNYYKPHIGGIEQTCHDIVEALADEYEQKVICFSEDKNTKIDEIDGVRVTKCGVWKKLFSQSISFEYKRELKKEMKEYQPDIVIFHFPNPYVSHYLLRYCKKNKIRFIVWYHSDIVKQKLIRLFFEPQTKKILKRADRIICTSPIYKSTSKNLIKFNNKVKVIPSCINEKRLVLTQEKELVSQEIRAEYKNKIIVFAFGRHVKYKGLTYLIEASKYLDASYQILIGGAGPLTAKLKQEAANDAKIKFLGKISDKELRCYLKAMDIYAFPSITKNEAFGLSLAEGMYFGHPAVTFTIKGSGVNYVSINDRTGLEVDNKNAKGFAAALDRLGTDKSLREQLGNQASQRVLELFTFDKFKCLVLELLKEESK